MPQQSWQGTNLPKVGGFNRAVVLDAIRAHGEVSRVELAEKTGLTAQTMSNIVRELIADGLVTEDGHAPSTGGKRRVLLRVVAEAYSAVGLHLDPERITGVVLDLSGQVQVRSQRKVADGSGPAAVVGALSRTFHQLVRRSGIDSSRVLGVGLAVPGPLGTDLRHVYGPPNLAGWDEVALADLVEHRVGLPVLMDNDATAAAIGERWTGRADRTGSFVYAYLGTGVGIGVVLGDQVYRGISNNAGEIGHVNHGGGRRCRCGRRGCLETYCSMQAIVDEWHSTSGSPRSGTVLAEYERICRLAAEDLAAEDKAVEDKAAARRVLRQAATRLGQTLASVVSILDIDRVVLGGPALRHVAELFRARVETVLNEQVWAREIRPVRVQTALIGEDAGAVGAASLVLDRAYSPRLTTLLGP